MTSRMKHRLAAAILAGLGLSLAGVAALSPTEPMPNGFGQPEPEAELSVIALKHMSVRDFANAAGSLMSHSDAVITFDGRSNSLVIMGTPEATQQVNDLVELLDIAISQEDTGDEVVQVFQLKYAYVNNSLINALSRVLGTSDRGDPELRFSTDESSNQLIARGSLAMLGQLEAVLGEIDKPAPSQEETPDINVRLIWLTSSASGEVPADVKDVTDALANMGITGLGMAAQTIIRTTNRSQFGSEFTTGGDEPWFVRFSGTAETSDAENWMLEVSVNGRQIPSGRENILRSVEFETRLSTRAGHFVVLGVSPIGDTDSVFVLQVIEVN